MLSSNATPVQLANNAAFLLRRTAVLLVVMLSIVLAGRAQQANAADPDYSGVKDILRGRRTLLSIDDLVIGGTVLETSDGTKIQDRNISELPGFQRNKLNPEIMARLFDWKSGALVYANGNKIYALNPISQSTTSLPVNDDFSYAGIAPGDFRGDGLQEIVIASFSGIRVVSAADPKEFSNGLYSGPQWNAPQTFLYRPAVAVGNFDGEGQPEVAVAFDSVAESRGRLNIYQVNPQSLALELKHSQAFTGQNSGAVVAALAAGRFQTTLHDQLFLGYYTTGHPTFKSFDFDGSLTPILKDTQTASQGTVQELVFSTGRFDPISPFDQVGVKWNQGQNNVQVGIISLDNSLKILLPNFATLPGIACSSGGLAVGSFARTEPVPQDPSKTQPSLKLQLAISTSNCAGSLGVNIYNVDPPKSAGGDFVIDTNAVLSRSLPQAADYGLPIIAADIQGRSVVLGEPTKFVIEETAQPSVIAAMPPMHVDFIRPSGEGQPTLLNLSAIPSGFRTVYETSETDTTQSSSTSTSSWSFGAEVNVGASVEIGSVDSGLGVEVGATARAAQDIKAINEKQYGSYQSSRFDASVETGFSDQVWYTDSRFNVYVYPVLGHNVCPTGEPSCTEKVPLTIQFSGPDKIESHKVDGNLIPWYQPPWEPGNVFSYPATEKQLQEILPNSQQLSKASTYRTDSGTATERATWTNETTEGATAGVDQNFSYELGFSVSGAVSGGFVKGKASASLNLSGSAGFSDLNKSVTSVGRSAGIGVEKPGTFRTPASYNYAFTPYILGQTKPGSVVDNEPLQADVTTFGLLRTAFTADPDRNDVGGWWKGVYRDKPDVALNHPSRWSKQPADAAAALPSNCLDSPKGVDCIVLEPSRPDNLWESNFHVMRGFFISNALSAGKGPQLSTATASDKLRLEARVYNYSFAKMHESSEVHVRFYAQQIDTLHQHRPVGDSVLINEVKLAPIPPFSDDDDAVLNWVLAKTDFDTTGYEGKYLIFWVVVWIQDANGNLVPETEGHGLTKIPGDLKSLAEVEAETYSNNVGFYNSAFYVFPEPSVADLTNLDGEPATIQIAETRLSGKRVLQGQIVDASATVTAENNSASGVTALFYDGDPHDGGVVFGLERIPYIAENESYQVEAPYRAAACGKHELYVIVHEGTPEEVLWSLGKIKVDCAQ
jgi:hypothetical protein